jgi:DNA-binding GntR family transcriptional regulator
MNHLSLKENAYHIIKQKILDGEIKLGDRIREDLLAEEIAMSRTPVREAINQLSVEGLIINIPRKGIYNINFDEDEMNNILEIREALEILTVRECINKITEPQLEKLKSINEKLVTQFADNNYYECSHLDREFHNEVAVITGNKKLIKFLAEIGDYIQIMRNIKSEDYLKRLQLAIDEHQLMVRYIEDKDLQSCIRIIKSHVEMMKENLGISKPAN